MMLRSTLALLVLAFLAPGAQAGLFHGAEVHVAPVRVGDVLRYEIDEPGAVLGYARPTDTLWGANHTTVLVQAEGQGRAEDAFGVARDASIFRVQRQSTEGDRPIQLMRCWLLAGGNETVRVEPLSYGSSTYWKAKDWAFGAGLGRELTINGTLLAEYPHGACAGADPLAGETLHEGDARMLDSLEAPVSWLGRSANLSEPAKAITFHGRDALAFDYPNGNAHVRIVFADGLPGPVSVIAYAPNGTAILSWELAGIRQGSGAALPGDEGKRLPSTMPGANIASPAPTSFDDTWIAASYHYADAVSAARADPRTGLDAWLSAHPEAVLRFAWFDSAMKGNLPQAKSEGGWQLIFAARGSEAWTQTVQYEKINGPVSVAPGVRDSTGSTYDTQFALLPQNSPMVDGAGVAAALRAHHIDPTQAHDVLLTRIGAQAILLVSELSSFDTAQAASDGRLVVLNAVTGAAFGEVAQHATIQRAALLDFPENNAGLQGARESFVVAPAIGAGLGIAIAAATGIALLTLLIAPLYTRLRRDRLLDHPIRARLHEHARAHPGIHLAELVDLVVLSRSAVKHHLDQLAKAGLLVVLESEGRTRYFAAGEVPPEIARREGLLRDGSYARVYEAYCAEPQLTLRDAARRLGISAPSVHRAKKRLEKEGLLPAGQTLSAPVTLADA